MSGHNNYNCHYQSEIFLDTMTLQCIEHLKDGKNQEKETYKLKETSSEELLRFRLKKKPIVILKFYDRLYYCDVPKDFKYLAKINLGPHLCSNCKNCSASRQFGCKKVADLSFQTLYTMIYHNSTKSMKESKRIEKYDWITLGLECINTDIEYFPIVRCINYSRYF